MFTSSSTVGQVITPCDIILTVRLFVPKKFIKNNKKRKRKRECKREHKPKQILWLSLNLS